MGELQEFPAGLENRCQRLNKVCFLNGIIECVTLYNVKFGPFFRKTKSVQMGSQGLNLWRVRRPFEESPRIQLENILMGTSKITPTTTCKAKRSQKHLKMAPRPTLSRKRRGRKGFFEVP